MVKNDQEVSIGSYKERSRFFSLRTLIQHWFFPYFFKFITFCLSPTWNSVVDLCDLIPFCKRVIEYLANKWDSFSNISIISVCLFPFLKHKHMKHYKSRTDGPTRKSPTALIRTRSTGIRQITLTSVSKIELRTFFFLFIKRKLIKAVENLT